MNYPSNHSIHMIKTKGFGDLLDGVVVVVVGGGDDLPALAFCCIAQNA